MFYVDQLNGTTDNSLQIEAVSVNGSDISLTIVSLDNQAHLLCKVPILSVVYFFTWGSQHFNNTCLTSSGIAEGTELARM
jgi:hypothetical protein